MSVFEEMRVAGVEPNVVTWTALIAACAAASPRRAEEAEAAFDALLRRGLQRAPDMPLPLARHFCAEK